MIEGGGAQRSVVDLLVEQVSVSKQTAECFCLVILLDALFNSLAASGKNLWAIFMIKTRFLNLD